MPIPKIIQQPNTHHAMQQGIKTLASAIRPTLGPLPRYSIHMQNGDYEVLDNGGIVARRLLQMANRSQDVGAMLLRQVLWQVHEQVGDGTATTAVLYEAVYNEGLRYLAAGANAMQLREHLLHALDMLCNHLMSQCQTVTDSETLKSIAYSLCYDQQMADVLGEVLDTVGQYGQIDIRAGHGRHVEYSFVEGAYWKGGVQSKTMLQGTVRQVAELENPAILVSDMDVQEPAELIALMQLAIRSKIKNLLLIVNSISDNGLAVVHNQRIAETIKVVVVKIDSAVKDDIMQAQQDMTALTGANPILKVLGQNLNHATEADFGWARWAWADKQHFGFAGGKGDPYHLRQHVATLRKSHTTTTEDDHRERLLSRLGRLQGGSATVLIGGTTDDEMKRNKAVAERTVRALRGALATGVVPGGGAALLNCQAMLEAAAEQQSTLEARAAYYILARAVQEPLRTLLSNAGYEPSTILAELAHHNRADGFNVMTQEFVNMAQAGILDVAHVQREALQRAVSGAAQALTIDTMILHRNPEASVEP